METKTKRRRIKDLSFWERIYVPEIVKGLALTLRTMFKPKFTMEYPEVKFDPPGSYRGRPVLVQEENGVERCVACGLCSRVCPALAIEVQAAETEGVKAEIPENFYSLVANRHLVASKATEEETAAEHNLEVAVQGLPITELLFYPEPYTREWNAKVLKIINGEYIVLDRTC